MKEEQLFGVFNKYYEDDNFIYYPLYINDPKNDIKPVFDFFFSADTLFNHFKTNNDVIFNNSPRCFSLLYRNLLKFVDEEISSFEYDFTDCSKETIDIIREEEKFFDSHSIRRDKIGKIGEYLASIILEKTMGYSCIIPKSDLITSKNMSVYGIDTLHYDPNKNVILFGESKFTSTLTNGIALISESLNKYEKRINDEIELIFTQRLLDSLNLPKDIFKDAIDSFVNVSTFVSKTGMKEIYIPLFIAHGKEVDASNILGKLKTIERKTFLGMTTKFIVISLPVDDTKYFIEHFTLLIKAKIDEYERLLNNE